MPVRLAFGIGAIGIAVAAAAPASAGTACILIDVPKNYDRSDIKQRISLDWQNVYVRSQRQVALYVRYKNALLYRDADTDPKCDEKTAIAILEMEEAGPDHKRVVKSFYRYSNFLWQGQNLLRAYQGYQLFFYISGGDCSPSPEYLALLEAAALYLLRDPKDKVAQQSVKSSIIPILSLDPTKVCPLFSSTAVYTHANELAHKKP